ncbi:MAG TPA: LacI family DNA-binding transcriptional regulator [Actinopolymorphaceae bacterium]
MSRTRRRFPTIDDVAARCGVATSTVSRAFSRPERVSAATRELILATAAAMGYRPNPIARALPSGRTLTLGLLVPDITNPFFLPLIRGAERRAAEAGYTLVLSDTEESPAQEATAFDRLHGSVDGYILASSRQSDDDLRRAHERSPLVVVNRRIPPVPGVVIDSAGGVLEAVRHLAELGHRRIGYLAGPATSWSNAQRWEALSAATQRLRLEVVRLSSIVPTIEGGEAAADAVLAADITALVTFNDLLAIGLVRELGARSVPLPDRLSIVGCDDIFGADFCTPALTTLTAPVESAGRAAVDLLLDRVFTTAGVDDPDRVPGSVPAVVTVPTRLTIRQSTRAVPEATRETAEATREVPKEQAEGIE